MLADGWKELIKEAVQEANEGDTEKIDLLSAHLAMVDVAKQELRNKGHGWTGLDILETVRQI